MNYLKLYQEKLGLVADGILGPATVKAMMVDLNITDKLFMAHLLGQMAHESGLWTNIRENLNYGEAGLLNIFKKYYTPALAKAHARQPEKIANHVYANRMGNGNEASGDGWKYRGLFGLQLTGKTNIQAFAKYAGIPVGIDPDEMAKDPRNYFLSGKYWFQSNGVDKLCKSTAEKCIKTVSKRVNGADHGLDDRIVKTTKMFRLLGVA